MLAGAPFGSRPLTAGPAVWAVSGGITGAAALTMASFAGVPSGTVAVAGAAAAAIGAFAGVATGSLTLAGAAAATIGAFAGVATGRISISAVSAVVFGAFAGSASGTVGVTAAVYTPAAGRRLNAVDLRTGAAGFSRNLHGGFDRDLGEY